MLKLSCSANNLLNSQLKFNKKKDVKHFLFHYDKNILVFKNEGKTPAPCKIEVCKSVPKRIIRFTQHDFVPIV